MPGDSAPPDSSAVNGGAPDCGEIEAVAPFGVETDKVTSAGDPLNKPTRTVALKLFPGVTVTVSGLIRRLKVNGAIRVKVAVATRPVLSDAVTEYTPGATFGILKLPLRTPFDENTLIIMLVPKLTVIVELGLKLAPVMLTLVLYCPELGVTDITGGGTESIRPEDTEMFDTPSVATTCVASPTFMLGVKTVAEFPFESVLVDTGEKLKVEVGPYPRAVKTTRTPPWAGERVAVIVAGGPPVTYLVGPEGDTTTMVAGSMTVMLNGLPVYGLGPEASLTLVVNTPKYG